MGGGGDDNDEYEQGKNARRIIPHDSGRHDIKHTPPPSPRPCCQVNFIPSPSAPWLVKSELLSIDLAWAKPSVNLYVEKYEVRMRKVMVMQRCGVWCSRRGPSVVKP
jgi:hypothetical protein